MTQKTLQKLLYDQMWKCTIHIHEIDTHIKHILPVIEQYAREYKRVAKRKGVVV